MSHCLSESGWNARCGQQRSGWRHVLYGACILVGPLAPAAHAQAPPDLADYARYVWRTADRTALAKYTGVVLDTSTGQWSLHRDWPFAAKAGTVAYYAEPILRGALSLAEASSDSSLFEELAGFYLTYLGRFTTVQVLNAAQPVRHGSLVDPGLRSARTLPWPRSDGQVDECPLCNAQVLAPAARLVRDIAARGASARTETQRRFLSVFVPLLAREHVQRLAAEAKWNFGVRGWTPRTLLDGWRAISRGDRSGAPAYEFAVHDRDLWLIGSAADLLEAARLAPDAVNLGSSEGALKAVVAVGIERVRESITLLPETADRDGHTVGSALYFRGDWDAYPDMAFAGDTGAGLPVVPRPVSGSSWDVSHLQRLPVFLRTLWDDKAAVASGFPTEVDLRAVVNQFVFVAFEGDLDRPFFHNFFDGRDGWYRVGMLGDSSSGYPPSRYCDDRVRAHPCLGTWAISGWGELACVSPDLDGIFNAIFRLAAAQDADRREFIAKYYTAYNQPLTFADAQGTPYASLLLGQVAGEYLRGRTC